MIVAMKKIAVIMQSKDAPYGIKQLRRQGLVHVEHQQPPKSKDLGLLQDDLRLLEQALDILSKEDAIESPISSAGTKHAIDVKTVSYRIVDLWKRIDHLEEFARDLKQKMADWQVWGDFDPALVRELAGKDIHVKFYQIPAPEFKRMPASAIVKKVGVKNGNVYCLLISRGKIECEFKETELPKISLAQMKERLKQDEAYTQDLKKQLREYLCYSSALSGARNELKKEIEFQEALNGMGQVQGLTYLAGYAPSESQHTLLDLAKREKWGILITEPAQEDNVPVLIRNPRWLTIISPIFKFLEILPGYRELDISLPFLIFFSIFFGILIGDAGYGLAYALIAFILHQKARRKRQNTGAFFLFYTLSFCAIIWGILTGTFFGHEWVLQAGYKPLVPALANDKGLQRFCFFLGALHLSIGHSWRGLLKLPSLSALSDAGWICLLWAAFFIARALILGDSFPLFGKWLIIAGVSLVILFTNPQKNILKGIGEGLGTLALSIMNSFTDVVSYIRLFAVGLAGVAIADAFNAMAAMVGRGNVFMLLAGILIALIGNVLAIVLGPVSVLVHGVRLNVLEFSGHANVSWSGIPYKPLKE
jgi:V/A-type H+-transporting ATPase subunit I